MALPAKTPAQTVAEIASSVATEPKFSSPVSAAAGFDEIYHAAEIQPPAHGYTITKVTEMLQSERIRTLPAEVKKNSILLALDAAGVKIAGGHRRRREARPRARHLRARSGEVGERAGSRTTKENSADPGRDGPLVAGAPRPYSGQQRRRRQGKGAILRLALARSRKRNKKLRIPYLISSRRIRSLPPAPRLRRAVRDRRPARAPEDFGQAVRREMPMWRRLSRMVRSFVGFFISVGENPEIILEQNIRDMNDQVPRMNESIAMVKANVTLLEKEESRYKDELTDLTAKVKASIHAGRDDLAGSFAVQLEQVRGALARTQGQLTTARAAFDKAMAVKKAFMHREGAQDPGSAKCHPRLSPRAVAEEGSRLHGAVRSGRHQRHPRRNGPQDRRDRPP